MSVRWRNNNEMTSRRSSISSFIPPGWVSIRLVVCSLKGFFSSHVHLMEQLTIDLVSHSLAFVSDPSTLAYRTILTEPMCSFCLELLSLPTLPVEKFNEEHPHYHLAKSLLDSIHTTANNRTSLIIKSYLNIIKQLQFQFMTEEELQTLHDLILRLRQVCFNSLRCCSHFLVFKYPNLSVVVVNLIKSIEDQLKSSLALIEKLVDQQSRIETFERCCSSTVFRPMAITKRNERVRLHQPHRWASNVSLHIVHFKIERTKRWWILTKSRRQKARRENWVHIVTWPWISKMTPTNFSRLRCFAVLSTDDARLFELI